MVFVIYCCCFCALIPFLTGKEIQKNNERILQSCNSTQFIWYRDNNPVLYLNDRVTKPKNCTCRALTFYLWCKYVRMHYKETRLNITFEVNLCTYLKFLNFLWKMWAPKIVRLTFKIFRMFKVCSLYKVTRTAKKTPIPRIATVFKHFCRVAIFKSGCK